MSLFERYLELGHAIDQEEKLAIYKYLLLTKEVEYRKDAKELLGKGELLKDFANGEIKYFSHHGQISYIAREKNSLEYSTEVRSMHVGYIKHFAIARIERFFAQSEVDVMSNFPVTGLTDHEEGGLEISVSPFYDLNYYSNGHGKFLGLIEKIRHTDDELLQKLLTS
jgi:hypothetical protein